MHTTARREYDKDEEVTISEEDITVTCPPKTGNHYLPKANS